MISEKFSVTDDEEKENYEVSIIWGVKDLDRSSVSLWNPEDIGELIWDEDFTIEPPENQQAIIELCKDLQNDT